LNILLVDDDHDSRNDVADFLRDLGHQVVECKDGQEAIETFVSGDFPMVLSDIKMPGMSGIELLQAISALPLAQQTDVVLFTGYGDMESAIAALRAGAYDYLLKPIKVEELAIVTEKIAEHQALLRENKVLTEHFNDKLKAATEETHRELTHLKKMVAQSLGLNKPGIFSESMRQIYQAAQKYYTDRSIPVLIQGETGSGKEVIAKAIHYGNMNNMKPFIDINCAALTSSLFESELFGYEAGAFTGGLTKGKKGKLDLAYGGTLFLDEVAEIPLELQGKLLRVIQEKEYYRVGGLKKIQTDVRIICATNVDLRKRVKEGSFRKDLYFRLKVGHIVIPSLRERTEDIIPLASMFLQEFSEQKGKHFQRISDSARKILVNYPWPGNVRELRNVMEWVAFMHDDVEIKPSHLSIITSEKSNFIDEEKLEPKLDFEHFSLPKEGFNVSLEEFINRIVQQALEMHNGNKSETARFLGISRRTLYTRLENIE